LLYAGGVLQHSTRSESNELFSKEIDCLLVLLSSIGIAILLSSSIDIAIAILFPQNIVVGIAIFSVSIANKPGRGPPSPGGLEDTSGWLVWISQHYFGNEAR